MSRFFGGGLALLLLVDCSLGAARPPSEELKALRGKLEAIKRDIARSEDSRGKAADALRSAEKNISESNRKLTELAAARDEVDQRLEALASRRRSVEQRLGEQRKLAARLLYQHYTATPAEALQALASGRSPGEVTRIGVYLDYIAHARRQILDGLRRDNEALRVLGERALEQQGELDGIRQAQVRERLHLDAERANRKRALADIDDRITRRRKEASALERDEKRLTKLVQDLVTALASRKARERAPAAAPPSSVVPPSPARAWSRTSHGDSLFERLKGQLLMPVRGELVGRFGTPRSDSGMSWRGLFIQAPAGREVKAVAAGRVVFADWLRGFGNLLIVDHGDGFMSLYGNNEALIGRIGDPVRSGDTVATVGASGGNTVTGLYFEMRYQGRPLDPMGWLNLK